MVMAGKEDITEGRPKTQPPVGRGLWQQFTIADGLPDMKIECIYEDSRGDLWIGTHDRGVVRFDGLTFEGFTRREGLAGHGVYSVIEDGDGVLWFGTSGGLNRYDGEAITTVDCGGTYSFLWGSCMDEDGVLWFGVGGRPGEPPTLVRSSQGRADAVKVCQVGREEGQSVNRVVALGGCQLLCGGQGLYMGSPGFFTELINPDTDVKELFVDRDRRAWISTHRGMMTLDRDGHLDSSSEDSSIEAMVDDYEGGAWTIGSDGRVQHRFGNCWRDRQRVEAVLWRGACVDRRGRLWISSYGMGVFCYDATRIVVFGEQEGLPSTQVKALAVCPEGRLWIGTTSGLASMAEAGIRVHKTGRRAVGITALIKSTDDGIVLGTRLGEVLLVKNDVVSTLSDATGIDYYGLSHLAEDVCGRIWFASRHGRGLGFVTADGETTCFGPSGDGGLPRWIGAMVSDPRGGIWLGSAGQSDWDGVCLVDDSGRCSHRVRTECEVVAMQDLGDGSLTIGTNEGVFSVEVESENATSLGLELGCSVVTALLTTGDGVTWIGTEGGGVYTYDGQALQHISVPNCPACNVVNAILDAGSSTMWFATDGGLLRYVRSTLPPQVKIENLLADGLPLAERDTEISGDVRRVSISFRGYSSSEPAASLVYVYRLLGHDMQWAQTSDRSVEYGGLTTNDYRFEVRAVDRDLNYSPIAGVQFAITSDPRTAAVNAALRESAGAGRFVGCGGALDEVRDSIQRLGKVEIPVLVTGETGTGKGLVAQALHEASPRRDGPLVHVNCGHMQESLVDSEMFGHERGAFTGAVSRRLGKFELARGGTIFLDEIGDLPQGGQSRLLNVLQEFVIERVGGSEAIGVDVRVVAATNRDLQGEVARGRFREDLFYRIAGFQIAMPPLRERVDDIPSLVDHFGQQFAEHLDMAMPAVSGEAMSELMGYWWPGNVRELEHVVRRAVLLATGGCIRPEHLGLPDTSPPPETGTDEQILPMREHERRYLSRVLCHTGGVIYGQHGAAALLGLPPSTLRSRLAKLGVDPKGNNT